MHKLLFFITLLLMFSCGKKETDPFTIPDDAVTSDTGLKYVILKKGGGTEAMRGTKVTVHYTGWLMDGKKFDSSVDRNRPFRVQPGCRQVIAGLGRGCGRDACRGKTTSLHPFRSWIWFPGCSTGHSTKRHADV